jgi:hypothetical protein
MMPGMPERRTHDYARNGITSLFAAFNVADGTVIGEFHRQHRAAEFKKFLVTIDTRVYGRRASSERGSGRKLRATRGQAVGLRTVANRSGVGSK